MEDPIARFEACIERASATEPFDATRCVLATADARGRPSARYVLCKGWDARGFVVYTNLESRKALEIADNPHAALVFHWHTTGLQVRVEGTVARVDDAEADAYFASRPRESQLGAWASAQSRPIADRSELEASLEAAQARFGDGPVPRPPFWGGYRVAPEVLEFWTNRDHRLHDRERYEQKPDGRYEMIRLNP